MWTLSGMEIQRHPSHYANAAQWLRYSNVSHPGDVEELTQTEQGGGNTEGSGDRTGELLVRQALPHTHITHTQKKIKHVSEHVHRKKYSKRTYLLHAHSPAPHTHTCICRNTHRHTNLSQPTCQAKGNVIFDGQNESN